MTDDVVLLDREHFADTYLFQLFIYAGPVIVQLLSITSSEMREM